MNNNEQFKYFHVTIKSNHTNPLFTSNNERAFLMSVLQRILSTRTILEGPLGYRSLAVQIDLLAFSLRRSSCQLVVFGVSRRSIPILCAQLCSELREYCGSYGRKNIPFLTDVRTLSGPHDALHQTVLLHCQHEDWEYDRYSSIGFYLHDRRGDWMRLWRLARLYGYDNENYRQLIRSALANRLQTIDA